MAVSIQSSKDEALKAEAADEARWKVYSDGSGIDGMMGALHFADNRMQYRPLTRPYGGAALVLGITKILAPPMCTLPGYNGYIPPPAEGALVRRPWATRAPWPSSRGTSTSPAPPSPPWCSACSSRTFRYRNLGTTHAGSLSPPPAATAPRACSASELTNGTRASTSTTPGACPCPRCRQRQRQHADSAASLWDECAGEWIAQTRGKRPPASTIPPSFFLATMTNGEPVTTVLVLEIPWAPKENEIWTTRFVLTMAHELLVTGIF
ncbi:hypothetical protein DFH07DRAFT_1007414 [Mycena maculata]|uniref:Uncharacterized protein n=1 Tax=Mycena maculata TaxID=230809 RepID=A0AAD7HKD6_9AGAR|nr:hypothetical protein DFH07DRAFT_1007414 [Mycena maculata]